MDPNYAPVAYFVLAALAAIIIGIAFALARSLSVPLSAAMRPKSFPPKPE
jgi:hypothetical protein